MGEGVVSALGDVAVADLLSIVADCEGHGIWNPESLVERGLPAKFVEGITQELTSSKKDPKGMIFDGEGNLVEKMTGVTDLNLLHAICADLGVDRINPYIGRGFEARELVRRINAHFKDVP